MHIWYIGFRVGVTHRNEDLHIWKTSSSVRRGSSRSSQSSRSVRNRGSRSSRRRGGSRTQVVVVADLGVPGFGVDGVRGVGVLGIGELGGFPVGVDLDVSVFVLVREDRCPTPDHRGTPLTPKPGTPRSATTPTRVRLLPRRRLRNNYLEYNDYFDYDDYFDYFLSDPKTVVPNPKFPRIRCVTPTIALSTYIRIL